MLTKITKPSEWFDIVLPRTVAEHPRRLGGFSGTFAFTITGENGGDWSVTISDSKAVVKKEADPTAVFMVKMREEHFLSMMNGELSGPVAYATGKLKFKGALTQAIKLRGLLFA